MILSPAHHVQPIGQNYSPAVTAFPESRSKVGVTPSGTDALSSSRLSGRVVVQPLGNVFLGFSFLCRHGCGQTGADRC